MSINYLYLCYTIANLSWNGKTVNGFTSSITATGY